jgi:hypothetical protein
MGRALQLLSGRVEKPSTTITAVTMDTGDSNTVRNANLSVPIKLLSIWADAKSAGLVRVRSPLLHDAVQGMRLRFDAENPEELLPQYPYQPLLPQDVLTIEATGPAGGGEWTAVHLLVEYDDLPGANAQLATWPQIADNIESLMGVECNLTGGSSIGQYGGAQAINLNFDLFKRNRYYAILGYTTDVKVSAVGVTGADFGNLRVGGPGSLRKHLTANWFVDLSVRENAPRIPIFNSANVAGVTVDLVDITAEPKPNVTFICALLKAYQPS